MSDERVEVAVRFFQESFGGDSAEAVALLEPDVSYTVPGSHRLAGVFRGQQAVLEHLRKLLEITNDTIDILRWEDWMAGVNHVAGLANMRLQRPGALHSLRVVYVVTMSEEDKIRRLELFFADQAAAERVFAG